MTTEHTPQDTTFSDLCHMHHLLADAHHNLHLAWMAHTDTTDDLDPNLSAAIDMVYAMEDRIYSALRRHPQHPLNAELDVPLAEDTMTQAPTTVHARLSGYRAWLDHNTQVREGDELMDFRGDKWEFVRISRAPLNGKTAKVVARRNGHDREFYAQVFNLIIT